MMSHLYQSATELVGQTPVLKLNKIVPEGAADVYIKLEAFNPGSSVKDRIALSMIEQAEKSGELQPGGTIIEPTSGNTGIGLAMIGAIKGYNVILVMPDTMSIERRKLMKAYGAKIILTPGAEGIKASIAKAEALAKENGYFLPLQFSNPANPKIHELTTGKELVADFSDEGLDAFVSAIGTGGTITGVATALKQKFPGITIYGVEPAESPVINGGNPGPHKIQGIGTGFIPDVLSVDLIDETIIISSEEALETARLVGQKEGVLVGISSGAAIKAAIKVAEKLGKGKKVVAIAPDNGERYLSTVLYQEEQ